jgi:hypothetical protein
VKINFEGRDWRFDEDEIDVKQATVLYLTYHMTIQDWIGGIGHVDQRSLHFTYWLMLQQNGVITPIAECNPKIIAFGVAYGEARQAVEEAEAAAKKAAEAEAAAVAVPTIPSPPGVPVSSGPAIPTVMTPLPPGPVPPATGY